MKTVALLFLWMAVYAPAFAAPPAAAGRVTVEQLDQWIAGIRKDRDDRLARQLAGFSLTERAGPNRIAKWRAALPGGRSRLALMAVTDAAAFLNPPACEIPSLPAPSATTEQRILARITDYVQKAMPRLPDFFAQRDTTTFEIAAKDRLRDQQSIFELSQMRSGPRFEYHAIGPAGSSGPAHAQLFWTGSFVQTVTYRHGAEVVVTDSSRAPSSQTGPTQFGLESQGEFGSILAVVLRDLPSGSIEWSRWELGAAGTLAVFRYTVPKSASHFAVDFNQDDPPEYPAYRGEIAVDPATGAIFRITILAGIHDPDSVYRVSVLDEFGPVAIGGVVYISPVRSVVLARYFAPAADPDAQPQPIPYLTSINDIAFTRHHVFRSQTHLLKGTPEP